MVETTGLDLHFCPLGKKYCSHQCLHWWQQGSTGALHLDGFESFRHDHKKITTRMGGDFFMVETTGLDLHICLLGKNYCSHQCLHWWQQGSTGALRLDGFESLRHDHKKITTRMGGDFLWWRLRDSICIFAFWAKIIVATSVCTDGSKAPPEPCIWMGSSPFTVTIKNHHPNGW